MKTLNHRPDIDSIIRRDPSRVLRAVVTVLVQEINALRTRANLAPLTAPDILAKLKAALRQ